MPNSAPSPLESLVARLCAEAPGDRTISPIDAAKALAAERGEDDLAWRSYLTDVRRAAVKMALTGRLVIYRKGKPVDPEDFRGVYRLGAPSSE